MHPRSALGNGFRSWPRARTTTLSTAGFTGWVLQPELAKTDVPSTHPFRSDWECMVALDQVYTGLLARGNVVPDGVAGAQAMADAGHLQIPVPDDGLLAVEIDQNWSPAPSRHQ